MSHLSFTLLMAVLVSGAAGLAGEGDWRERSLSAARMFLGCTATVVAGGWAMHAILG